MTDDIVGVSIDPTGGVVCTEAGSTGVFKLSLSSEPISSVTIQVNSSDTTEGNVGNVSAITFTPLSWSSQAVTVTGVDDDVVDGNISFFALFGSTTSSDSNYHDIDGKNVDVTTKDGKFHEAGHRVYYAQPIHCTCQFVCRRQR
jgi:hypothetical protein